MARNIFIVNATQVVVSDSHPEGLYSVISGYPKTFDSRNYAAENGDPNGDEEAALRAAKSEYHSRLSANYAGSTTRVMSTVTLDMANGRNIMRESLGAFPTITVQEPEPEVTGDEEP